MDLSAIISRLRLEISASSGPLRLFRLLCAFDDLAADFLAESLPAGRTIVEEATEHGIVGRVRVTHQGALPLLLLDGEQITGAKQDRIVNASFIVLPGPRSTYR